MALVGSATFEAPSRRGVVMHTERPLIEPEYEPAEVTDDAHEHGLVFRQIEDEFPLRADDVEDDDATASE